VSEGLAAPIELLCDRAIPGELSRWRGDEMTTMIPRSRVLLAHAGTRPRVIAPVLIGQLARPAISVGDALVTSPGGSGNLLALVEIRAGRDNEVFAQEQRRRDVLRWVAALEYRADIRSRMSVTLRMTANAASSIRDAVAETEATSLVLEWPTITSPRRHGLTDLNRQLLPDRATDILFVRSNSPHKAIAPHSILASIRGGPSARKVASTAALLADAYGSALTLLHIRTGSQHPDRSRREWASFEQIVEEIDRPSTMVRLQQNDSPARGILEAAEGHDLVIIGARLSLANPNAVVGRELLRMVRNLGCPVVMVRPKHAVPGDSDRVNAVNGHSS
jgi:nucleotide-binding universal stress UspA family protein